jgi:hypothetical protein
VTYAGHVVAGFGGASLCAPHEVPAMTATPGRGRRFLAIGLATALAVAVGIGIFVASTRGGGDSGGSGGSGGRQLTTVSGLSGSEKLPYFTDPAVVRRLAKLGFKVDVEPAGSREIATEYDLDNEDFVFPAGVPAALQVRLTHKQYAPVTTFFTPMAIATFEPIAELMVAAGVSEKKTGYYTLDVAAFLDLVRRGVRWTDLEGNSDYPVDKSILITSTDVRSSNSAAMYLSLASFVANGNAVVDGRGAADKVLPVIKALFLKQGFVASSSEEPFQDYLSIGMGKSPLVMIYEAQFVNRAARKDGSIRPDMVLMYPRPTVLSKHTFVPLTEKGERLGKALATDPVLQQLAVQYGFRTAQPGAFQQFTKDSGVAVESDIIDAVDPPSFETLEYMIDAIERAYRALGSTPQPSSSPSP